MMKRQLGRTGIEVTSVCLGTMTWGEQNTREDGFAQMDYAVDRGVNFFDTAELYSIPPRPETLGATETIIGDWFAARGGRDRIVLATKIVGRTDTMTWFRKDGRPPRITADQIDEAVEASLRRLRTDYIDLYQIHWPDRGYAGFGFHAYKDYAEDYNSIESQLEALARYVDKGSIRAIGLSNESPWGVMKFLSVAEARGWPRIASIQNAYNLVNRVFEYGLAEIALRESVGLLAYSPLGQGYLTGKYRGGALPAGSRKAMFQRLGRYENAGGVEAVEAFIDLAGDLGVSPIALALKFCDTRAFMTSTIIGATTLEQLKADLDAFDAPWTPHMEAAVDRLHEIHRNPCP